MVVDEERVRAFIVFLPLSCFATPLIMACIAVCPEHISPLQVLHVRPIITTAGRCAYLWLVGSPDLLLGPRSLRPLLALRGWLCRLLL